MSTGACRCAVGQHREHRHLAVVDLAQAAGPLPGHANRAIPLFGKAALVDDQAAGRLAAQQTIRVLADLRHHRLVVPRRVADEMLELLRAATFNHGGHRRERAILGLRQAMQIAPRHRGVVPRARAEELAVTAGKAPECLRDPLDQRCGQPSSAHTVTRRTASFISSSESLDVRADRLI